MNFIVLIPFDKNYIVLIPFDTGMNYIMIIRSDMIYIVSIPSDSKLMAKKNDWREGRALGDIAPNSFLGHEA